MKLLKADRSNRTRCSRFIEQNEDFKNLRPKRKKFKKQNIWYLK